MEEIRQLQKSKYAIEKDLADKEAALDIDKHTSVLKVTGPGPDKKKTGGAAVTKYPVEKMGNIFSPADWQEFSEKNLQLASSQIKSSIALDAMIDGVMAHVASHLKSQKDLTDRAFDRCFHYATSQCQRQRRPLLVIAGA